MKRLTWPENPWKLLNAPVTPRTSGRACVAILTNQPMSKIIWPIWMPPWMPAVLEKYRVLNGMWRKGSAIFRYAFETKLAWVQEPDQPSQWWIFHHPFWWNVVTREQWDVLPKRSRIQLWTGIFGILDVAHPSRRRNRAHKWLRRGWEAFGKKKGQQ